MKIARLHDGSLMHFPPEVDDAHIGMAVRKRMGVPEPVPEPQEPPPPEPGSAAEQDAVVLLQQLLRVMQGVTTLLQQSVQAQGALASRVDQLAAVSSQGPDFTPVVAAIQKSHGQAMQAHRAVASAVDNSHKGIKDAIDHSHKQITSAIKAPKKVQYGKNGRPVGVSTEGA